MDYNNINKDISNTNRDEITAAVDFAYKTIDTLALYAREKSDSVIDMLSKVSPNEMCNFGIRNGIYMMRLMRLNEKEREITLNALGTDAVLNGDSSSITGAALSPSYAKGYNYVDTFVNIHKQDISSGIDVTSINKINNRSEELELGKRNLYHDDNGTGEFDNKINSVNLNSILNKTKRLFNQHKINTIISRFHTDSNLTENSMDVRTEYGLSHGRNLLTGDAQRKGKSYSPNGYDNPYCRVWTHHHQYDSLDKRMRPFMNDNGVMLAENFHKWENFENKKKDTVSKPFVENGGIGVLGVRKKEYGWKDDTDGWKDSVLGENGFVNITPKFQGGGKKNIHTKQCMFSIENLAWKDYDPYSFEKALSWEQRGPMGGRIMWFPPYGISFNETTSTNWNSSTFIGRGEDIYTYINTVRTGTLNFMLLVDHPSILDYVSWGGRNNNTIKNVSDDDVHRFFAGCDNVAGTGGSNETGGKLSDYAKPTPLTDEYTEIRKEEPITPDKKPTPTQSTEPQISTDEDIKITFYVFFPNNYAGYYDRCDNKYKTNVEAIPYLLYGKGAQMKLNEKTTGTDKNPTKNLPLNFNKITRNEGCGYEMQTAINNTYENDKNYIIGTDIRWWDNKNNNKTYQPSKTKKWYYRIDGRYVTESIPDKKGPNFPKDALINCYDQNPEGGELSYYDTDCYNLNCDTKEFKDAFNEINNENLYTLSEVAQALAKNNDISTIIARNAGNNEAKNEAENVTNRIDELKKIFGIIKADGYGYKLVSVDAIGYSNEQGKTINDELKKARNETLAQNRAETVINWLKKYLDGDWKANPSVDSTSKIGGHQVSTGDTTNVSGKTAKLYRSAKVVMYFKREASTTLPDANQQENSKINTGGNLINNIINEIDGKVIKYRKTTDDNLNDKEQKDINNIIDSNIDKLGSNYSQEVKAEIKTELSDIKFTEKVYGGKFTLFNEEDSITSFINAILDISTVESKYKMTDDDDFYQKLGILIKEGIEKFKKVQDKRVELEWGKDWQYSQTIEIKSDDIYDVINNYFKKGNVNIDYIFVKDISDRIAPKIDCVVRHKVNDINLESNEVIVDITFASGCYEIYNNAIEKGVTDGNNTAVNVDKGKLSAKLKELNFKYNGETGYKKRYAEYENVLPLQESTSVTLLEGTGLYNLPFDDETVNRLSEKLSTYPTKDAALKDINSIKSLLNDEFKKYLYIYIVSVYDAVIQEKTDKVMKILHKYNKNMDKSEYIGFSKHMDKTTKETYYINDNETDPKKKNLQWVEELDKNGKPTGKLVLKYIDNVETRASVTYDEQKGIIDTDNIKGDFNKSRYDQEYYFFSILKDKDRMTYEKVMDKIQYFDPAFHSMTPEGFSARLNFLNQCMRAGNTVTASDGIHAKSANNLAFGRPPFCVLRLGDWYNQMIVIDNISISYDPLVWDLNEEGIGVIPLIANVSMSFKFIGGGDLGGPVRRLQNAMSFNYYANGRLYDNRSDRMKYKWNDKTCGALKGNEIDIENSYFYTAQNYEE